MTVERRLNGSKQEEKDAKLLVILDQEKDTTKAKGRTIKGEERGIQAKETAKGRA